MKQSVEKSIVDSTEGQSSPPKNYKQLNGKIEGEAYMLTPADPEPFKGRNTWCEFSEEFRRGERNFPRGHVSMVNRKLPLCRLVKPADKLQQAQAAF